MAILRRTLTFILLLGTAALHAQWVHWGLDEMVGIHYNTLDAGSYKTPVGDIAAGLHVTLSDPDDPRRVYFNGRLTFGNDFQTYTLPTGTKLDFALRDLVCSFQAHKAINEKIVVYAGLNLSFNTINTVWYRYEGGLFSKSRERMKMVEAMVGQKIRKLNAGVEAGFMCPMGKGFSMGMHLSYYVLRRLKEDLDLASMGFTENVSLNFRPLALRLSCAIALR